MVKGLRVVFCGPDDGFGTGRGRHGEVITTHNGIAAVRWDESPDRKAYAKHSNARFEDLVKEVQ